MISETLAQEVHVHRCYVRCVAPYLHVLYLFIYLFSYFESLVFFFFFKFVLLVGLQISFLLSFMFGGNMGF